MMEERTLPILYRLSISEEKRLAKTFDKQYREYTHRVPRFLGREAFKIFQLPKELSFTEGLVEAALIIPFILWFAEALVGVVAGTVFVRTYWFPIAYALPIHIGVVISLLLLLPIFLGLIKHYISKKRVKYSIVEREFTEYG